MGVLTVGDRTVFLRRGKGTSDTVNVCDAANRVSQYEWKIRVFKPTAVTENDLAGFRDVPSMIEWLKNQPDVVVEKPEAEPSPCVSEQAMPLPSKAPYDATSDPWMQEAKWLVEHTLEQLAHEVMEFPYLHRCEHSLHARLFAMLSAQPHFSRLFPLANTGTFTQTIHKEWPETKPEQGHRRGNFDLAVLAPAQLTGARLDDFLHGRIPAPIVIEIGLDYGASHLAEDEEKLLNSDVQYPYLVHIERERYRDPKIDRILLKPSGRIRTIYVHLLRGETFYKMILDTDFQSKRMGS